MHFLPAHDQGLVAGSRCSSVFLLRVHFSTSGEGVVSMVAAAGRGVI